MKTRSVRITTALIALAFFPAAMHAAGDLSLLLEKKHPEAKEVITSRTIFRESKLPQLPIDENQIEFLIDHPRLALALAHFYDPSLDAYSVEPKPGGVIHIFDPAGLAGDAELIYAVPGRRIYFITGYFDILAMRFNGQMVLVTEYMANKSSPTASVDAVTSGYIKVNSSFAGVFAGVLDYLFPGKVDARIARFIHAVTGVVHAVHDDPAAANKLLSASGTISTEERKAFAGMFLPKMRGEK